MRNREGGSFGRVQGSRIILSPTPEEREQWESWARTNRKPLPWFIVFVMNMAVRYFREMERGRRTDLDALGLRIGRREKLLSAVEAARDALDKLADALR